MARPRKPARLYLHPTERVWLIRDAGRYIRTGCPESRVGDAEKAFTAYLAAKFVARRRVSDPADLPVTEVLTVYATEHAIKLRSAASAGFALDTLGQFFRADTLADIRKDRCAAYADWRRGQARWPNRAGQERRDRPVSNGTIRRELAILSAAIGYWHATHGPLTAVPTVTLPEAPPGRERFLEHDERVRLLAGALGFWREAWCDLADRQEHGRWRRERQHINRHLARFILLAVATGSRSGVVLSTRWFPNTVSGWVDLPKAMLYRRALDEIETKKRKPPSALGYRIMAHLRRWSRIDAERRSEHVAAGDYQTIVHWRGKEVRDITRAWAAACDLAYLPTGNAGFVRHSLRHTRATMLMRDGVDVWQAAGQLGMSPKLLQERYGHHSPHFQERAKNVR